MAIWEYKVITSGKGGFATPVLLEKFLNDLGKEEWEIVEFRTQVDNMLAFSGLARRPTQRDWTLADAAAAAAKAEAEKLRAEFEAKFKGASVSAAPVAEEQPESLAGEKAAADDGLRRLRDTERDLDPDAPEEEVDEWDKLASEDELPTFFDAIRPHMRRNQRGPGMAVGIEYLAKKWDFSEEDIKGALLECGFAIPEDDDAKPEYIEYDGDLYWLNINRRGELWINTKEKPRPVFRVAQGQRVAPEAAEEAKPENGGQIREEQAARGEKGRRGHERRGDDSARKPEPRDARPKPEVGQPAPERGAEATGPAAPLPEGPALLEKIRPLMRRNRRGPGGSGSTSFLSRALKISEADLMAAFATLGLVLSPNPADKPANVEIGDHVWWLNKDQRGGVWINGRGKREGDADGDERSDAGAAQQPESGERRSEARVETGVEASAPTESQLPLQPVAAAADSAPASRDSFETASPLAAVRLLLKQTKTGSFSGEVGYLSRTLHKDEGEFVATLVGAGLKVPEKAREKPVFVEHAGEIFWLNKNAKDELWLNAKASKFSDQSGDAGAADGEKRPSRRGGRSRKKDTAPAPEPAAEG